MRRHLDRLTSLLARYRVDRRLPPPVSALVRDLIELRTRDRIDRGVFALRRFRIRIGTSSPIGRLRGRALLPAGPIDVSMYELRHRFASEIVERLTGVGIDVFVVGRRNDHLVFGVGLEDRGRALRAISDRDCEHWYLQFDSRRTSKLVPLQRASRSHAAQMARTWRIFQALSWGDRVVGIDQAIELTFWELGRSGQLELVGTRGHERFEQHCDRTIETVDGHEYPGRAAFPVGSDLARMADPIDIVYTWVDGAEPSWQAAFRSTAREHGRRIDEVALDPARYRSRDELRYSLRSVWAFCGWVRRIYIVTAGQVPEWLVEDDRVRVVDHSEILPADALPTFNSHALESALHRIDGLAEHFIYFNDDMLVGRSLQPEDFFTPNGLARVFQGGARVPALEDESTLAVDTAARRGRELLLERFGKVVLDKPFHSPYPLRRSVMEEIESEFPEIVKRTSHSRFRSPSDLSIAASFAQHYAVGVGKAVFGNIHTDYVNVESGRLSWHLDRIRLAGTFDTFCINETEVQGTDHDARESMIRSFFDSYFPVAAPWEIEPLDEPDRHR